MVEISESGNTFLLAYTREVQPEFHVIGGRLYILSAVGGRVWAAVLTDAALGRL